MRQFCQFISRKYAGGLPMGKSTVHYKLTEESKKLPLYCNLMHNWDLSKWNRVCGSRKTFRLDTHLWLFPKRSKQNHPLSEKEIETEDKDNLQNLNEVDSKSYRKEAKWGATGASSRKETLLIPRVRRSSYSDTDWPQ